MVEYLEDGFAFLTDVRLLSGAMAGEERSFLVVEVGQLRAALGGLLLGDLGERVKVGVTAVRIPSRCCSLS